MDPRDVGTPVDPRDGGTPISTSLKFQEGKPYQTKKITNQDSRSHMTSPSMSESTQMKQVQRYLPWRCHGDNHCILIK